MRPIFVHSLFRAGSTYIFHAFRRAGNGHYRCFQEPLHEQVAELPDHADKIEVKTSMQMDNLRHPLLVQGYFHEFLSLREAIRRNFTLDLPYDLFFLDPSTEEPRLHSYITSLIADRDRQTVLQFCRSTGRIAWLSRHFDAIHLYLLRNPWDQWWSYRVEPYFDTTTCLILTAPSAPPLIRAISAEAAIKAATGSLTERMAHYNATPLPMAQSYLCFYSLWLYSLLQALPVVDNIIAMDLLSESSAYRERTLKRLAVLGAPHLDFTDCTLPRRCFSQGDANFFRAIETRAQTLFLSHGVEKEALDAALAQVAVTCVPRINDATRALRNTISVLNEISTVVGDSSVHSLMPPPELLATRQIISSSFFRSSDGLLSLLKLNNAAFVYHAFQIFLGRSPDVSGFRHYRHQLHRRRYRLAVIWELSRSAEAQHHRHPVSKWLHFAATAPKQITDDWPTIAKQLLTPAIEGMGENQKLLLVLSYFPVATTKSGGAEKIRGLYCHLPTTYRVVLITLSDNMDTNIWRLSPNCIEICLPLSISQRIHEVGMFRAQRLWMLSRTSAQHPLLLALIGECVRRKAVVILSHPYLGKAAEAGGATHVVYDSHNAEYCLTTSLHYGRLAQRDIARCEANALAISRFATSVSVEDQRALTNIAPTGLPIHLLHIGSQAATQVASISTLQELKHRLTGDRSMLIFVASNHPPNREAANYLLGHVAPLLADVAVLAIVGSVCDSFAGQPVFHNVWLFGQVDEAIKEALYAMTDVALNPINEGSGANVKLAEYLVNGLPVLTTPFGARGFTIKNNVHAVIRERRGFAEAVRWLLVNPAQREALGTEALAYARTHLAWDKIATNFAKLIEYYFPTPS